MEANLMKREKRKSLLLVRPNGFPSVGTHQDSSDQERLPNLLLSGVGEPQLVCKIQSSPSGANNQVIVKVT